jgi:leader peptidase (prepilin peptidase)/N-methyltransferase
MAMAAGLLALWAALTGAPAPVLIASTALAPALLALGVIDVATFRLPDALTLPLIAAGLALALVGVATPGAPPLTALGAHALTALAGYAVVWGVGEIWLRWRGVEGMGLGDAKLLAAIGAWLGPAGLPWALLAGCLIGLIWALAAGLRAGSMDVRAPVPFGPALAAGFWLAWLYGPP